MTLDPGWVALMGTVCGGTGLKVVEHLLNKGQARSNEASRIREELREQIEDQREEIRRLGKEVDSWREKYYDLRDSYITLQTQTLGDLQKIKEGIVRNDNN
jgi:hypothetical protein